MQSTCYIFGGSFNPGGLHHRRIAEVLRKLGGKVVVVPCGMRPDKASTNTIEPVHRAAIADMTFRGIPGVSVELFDLERDVFTPTLELENMFRAKGFNVRHVIGSDLLQRGKDGKNVIRRSWYRGEEAWKTLHYAVTVRPGFPVEHGALPPHHVVLPFSLEGASSDIRKAAYESGAFDTLVVPEAACYIKRHRLYTGIPPLVTTHVSLGEPHIRIVADPANAKAQTWVRRLSRYEDASHPNLIVVIGGDGWMLRAIRKHWRLRVPFFGIKAGFRGHLLNDISASADMKRVFSRDLTVHHLPMLYVEAEGADGKVRTALAFNDAWVERTSGQTARIKVSIDGKTRLEDLWCDAVLAATAQGSTGYARAMGASPLLVGSRMMVLAASCVVRPLPHRPAYLPLESIVSFGAIGPEKRPVKGYADGVPLGRVVSMNVRTSHIAAAEVAFLGDCNLAEKLMAEQFPEK